MPLDLGSCGAWDGIKPNHKIFRLIVFIFATFFKDGVFKDGVLKDGILCGLLIFFAIRMPGFRWLCF